MPINTQSRASAGAQALTSHTPTVLAERARPALLIINGGSSSIRFALYDKDEPLQRLLDGKLDRVGLSDTNLTFRDAGRTSQDSRTIDVADHRSAVAFLLDWLETQQVFA
jgi:acetate kinase